MTLAQICSGALQGIDGIPVDVELDMGSGLPAFNIVGLPDAAVQEARARRGGDSERRVRVPAVTDHGQSGTGGRSQGGSALRPADRRRDSDRIGADREPLRRDGADGGAIPRWAAAARQWVLPFLAMCHSERIASVVVPAEDVREAGMVGGVSAFGLSSLTRLKDPPPDWDEPEAAAPECAPTSTAHDLSVVRGQEHVKRAIEVAASGGHNPMMQGPPGSGKTLLARALPGLIAPLTSLESIDVSKVYSIAGLLSRIRPLLRERPFRSPHHTISHAGLVGGGSLIRPGEVSLAHTSVP